MGIASKRTLLAGLNCFLLSCDPSDDTVIFRNCGQVVRGNCYSDKPIEIWVKGEFAPENVISSTQISEGTLFVVESNLAIPKTKENFTVEFYEHQLASFQEEIKKGKITGDSNVVFSSTNNAISLAEKFDDVSTIVMLEQDLALYFEDIGIVDESVRLLEKHFTLKGIDQALALNHLAYSMMLQRKDLDKVEKVLDKVHFYGDEYQIEFSNLVKAKLYYNNGRLDEASRLFSENELVVFEGIKYRYLGEICLEKGDYDSAVKYFVLSLENAGNYYQKWYSIIGLGKAYNMIGDDNQSINFHESNLLLLSQEYEKAIPSIAEDVVNNYVELLLKKGMVTKALVVARFGRNLTNSWVPHYETLTNGELLKFNELRYSYRKIRINQEKERLTDWELPIAEQKIVKRERTELINKVTSQIDSLHRAPSWPFEARTAVENELIVLIQIVNGGWRVFTETKHGTKVFNIDDINQLAGSLESEIRVSNYITLLIPTALDPYDIHAHILEQTPLNLSKIVRYSMDLGQDLSIFPLNRNLIVANPTEDLPKAEEEGRFVFNLHSQNSDLFVGQKATYENIFLNLGQVDLFHFAGHATKGKEVWDSALILADKGSITTRDILMIENSPSVVLLTGCETTRFTTTIGLAQAFVASGSKLVIASYRPLNDDLGLEFSRLFYQFLQFYSPEEAYNRTITRLCEDFPNSDWKSFRLITP